MNVGRMESLAYPISEGPTIPCRAGSNDPMPYIAFRPPIAGFAVLLNIEGSLDPTAGKVDLGSGNGPAMK